MTPTARNSTAARSIFGDVHLGYVVIETRRFTDWRRFGRDAVGMDVDEPLSDTMRFQLDDHTCRFLLQRGPAEDVTALGWELEDHDVFEAVAARISAHGVALTEGSADDAALRGVERLAWFPGPNGLRQEIYTRPLRSPSAPALLTKEGFVTGDSGLGHVAIVSKHPHQMHGYYRTVFDARLSDYIDETISGLKFKIRFLRVNERHHTVAIASANRLPITPIRTRIQHLNVQVAALDDMVAAYQRMAENGFGIALSIGQHTNDKELSFYAITPSGFEWEVGWNPIVIDDEDAWEPTTHQGISIWGHTAQGQTIIDKLAQFKLGAKSLVQREDTVPALSMGIPDH